MCCVYSHGADGHGGGEALTDVFEEMIGGQELRGPRDQVLLQLEQLSPPTQKHLDTNTLMNTRRRKTIR